MNKKMQDRMDLMLDQALEMTFPASDPIAIYRPERDDTDGAEPTVAQLVRPPINYKLSAGA